MQHTPQYCDDRANHLEPWQCPTAGIHCLQHPRPQPGEARSVTDYRTVGSGHQLPHSHWTAHASSKATQKQRQPHLRHHAPPSSFLGHALTAAAAAMCCTHPLRTQTGGGSNAGESFQSARPAARPPEAAVMACSKGVHTHTHSERPLRPASFAAYTTWLRTHTHTQLVC
jgi:hypothetical protein